MPPANQVRPWMLVYYALPNQTIAPTAFWREHGRRVYESGKEAFKVDNEVRRVAAATIGDAATPEAKLERLFEYCRLKIKNVNNPGGELTPQAREKFKEGESPAETIKRGMGTGREIDFLFASLAIAAGFRRAPRAAL